MTNKTLLQAALILLSLVSRTAFAVEAPKPVITLFNTINIQVFAAGIDISSKSGIEALGFAEVTNSNLPVTNPDKRKSRTKFKIKVKRSTNNSNLGSFVAYVDTKSYPDPYTAVDTQYYCEVEGEVFNVDPKIEDFPCDFELNLGIANSGTTRYLVMSLAVFAWYQNVAEGTVDIGQASVTIFDPESYTKLWRKTWKNTAGDWDLEDNQSAVGDYLNADGIDEVRIVYSRGLPNNAAEMKFTYYDIATGSKIKERKFTVASP